MEIICFFTAGVFVFLLVAWFISALFRIFLAPSRVLKKWRQMTPEELKRCAALCEMFLKEELKMSVSQESLNYSMPCLLNLFPAGIARLKGYLKYGPVIPGRCASSLCRRNPLSRPGEYFYGFGSILLAAFIGEALRRSCGAVWQMTPAGPLLQIPESSGSRPVMISPIHKLVELRNVLSEAEKEEFEEYLRNLCLLQRPAPIPRECKSFSGNV